MSGTMFAASIAGLFVGACLGPTVSSALNPPPAEFQGEFDIGGFGAILATLLGSAVGASLGGLAGALPQLIRTRSPWTRGEGLPLALGVGLAALMATVGPRDYGQADAVFGRWVAVGPELAATVGPHRTVFSDGDVAISAFGPSGRVRWRHVVPSSVVGGIGADGDLVAAVVADRVYAFEPNGALRWTAQLPGVAPRSHVTVADGMVRVEGESSAAFAVATGEPVAVPVRCRADAAYVCGDRGDRRWAWRDDGLVGSAADDDLFVPLPSPVLDNTLRPWPASLPRFLGVVARAPEGAEIVVVDLEEGRIVRRLRSPLDVPSTRIADGPSGFAFYDGAAAVSVDGNTGAVHAARVRGDAQVGRGAVWFADGRDYAVLEWPDLKAIHGDVPASAAPELLVDLPL